MAEEPMLGLFEGDTNFLDELAGQDLGSSPMLGVTNPPPMGNIGQHSMMSQGGTPQDMMNNMTGSYQQGAMGQDSSGMMYTGMPGTGDPHSQQNLMGHQQYPRQYDQYAVSKAEHNQAMMMVGPTLQQQPQQQHVQSPVGPFSPPMGGSMMPQQQQAGIYPGGYGMHPQQQQMSPLVGPNVGWNQAQTSPNQPTQTYMGGPQGPGGSYMGPQSYHNQQPQQQIPQRNQYTPSSPYIGPQSAMQTGMASPSTSMGGLIGSPLQGHSGSYPVVSQNHNPMMQPGFNAQMNQSMSQYQSNNMMSAHAPTSQMAGNSHQHFPPYSSSQQQAHFANPTASAGAGAYCPTSYPGMQTRMPNTTATASPRPTPPPSQQISNNHSATANTSSQGGYGTSSLQQLEQLVSPSLTPGANPYQQIMQQGSSSPVGFGAGNSGMNSGGSAQQGPIYSSPNFPTTTSVVSTLSMAGATQAGAGGMMTPPQGQQHIQGQQSMSSMHTKGTAIGFQNQLNSGPPHPGPLSPSQSSMLNAPQSQGMHPQQQMEASRLEQQLQQLMSMPKNPQVSQQIMELQERLHMVRSQNQHMQQQQPPQMGQPSSVQMPQVRMRMQQHQQLAISQQGMGPMHNMGSMNNQPMHLQQQQQQHQQNYPLLNGPGSLFPGQAGGQGVPSQYKTNQSVPSPQKVQPFQSPSSTSQMDSVQKKSLGKASLVSIQPADSLTIDHPGATGFPDSLQSSPAKGPKLDSFQIPMLDQLTDRESASSSSAATSTTTMSALEQDNAARVIQEVASRSAEMVESSDRSNLMVGSSDFMPSTITEIAEATEGQGEKPKRKRVRVRKPKVEKPPEIGPDGEPIPPKEKKPRKPREPKEPKPPKEPKEPKPPKAPKPKEPKEPKPKRVRTPKEPKEPKEQKPRAPRVRKRKGKQEGDAAPPAADITGEADVVNPAAVVAVEGTQTPLDVTATSSLTDGETPSSTTNLDGSISGVENDPSVDDTGASLPLDDSLKVDESTEEPDGLVEKVKTPRTRKPRAPKTLKLKTPRKRKTPSLILKGKKRKRRDSGSDVELSFGDADTSVDGADPNAEKRRSTRNTKRTKYIDDIDLNLSDDDGNKLDAESGEGPVTMKKDTEEDQTLIVDKVLGERMRIPDDDSLPDIKEETGEPSEKKDKGEAPSGTNRGEPNGEDDKDKSANCSEQETVNKESLETKEELGGQGNKDTEKTNEHPHSVSAVTAISNADKLPKRKKPSEPPVEEFYVKYKNYSYLHCEWRTLAELERGDKRVLSKIKRFRMKKAQNYFEADDEELFNPDYVEVDRVLDMLVTTNPETQGESTNYLVKWRSLSYEEATWELAQDVDPKKVEMYMRFRESPAEEDRKVFARPRPGQWRQLEESAVYKNNNTLRDYQLEGINWLSFCYYNGQNCILADEMGLGKTIQSITFLNEIYSYGIKGPFLVIVPLSTVGNWQREFETWTDMNVVVYHGTTLSRNMIKEYELFYKDDKGKRIPDIYRFEALITTFEIILTDFELLADIDWRCAIIDEAHRLKNKNCRLLEGLRQFELEHRVLLTGTPLQNNTEELYSLLNFLSPNKFNSSESFIKEFGDLKTEEQVDSLKEILKPMMLRRLKEDVEKNLAPKEETIIEVELTNIQKKYYRAILERNFQFLAKGSSGSIPSLMNTMMELRKCCNHPFLINGAEDNILQEAREKNPGDHNLILQAMVQSSGKMVLMDKLLPRLKSSGHKVLIFSQMIRVLDIIEDYLIQNKYLYERLDGRIRGTVRQEAIDRFSKPDSDRFAFLLCTRAGGLGINLTAADTVVIYDSDWNPQNDLQAQARCHRIGQEKAVKIYRLITRNSYEREMFDRASLKLGLDKAVLQSMGGEKVVNPASQMSKKEIEDLLKKGAYGALMEEDNAGDSFCEEDIDMILQRRTKVIQIESEGKGSTFAKASFSMTENRSDIDINDPNFWQKWAKKADIDTDASKSKSELIVDEPRQRRQTNRYGNDDAAMEISDLESSSGTEDENGMKVPKTRKSRGRGKNADEDTDYANDIPGEKYDRCECFKVEKLLLVYGWGRWSDLLKHAHFKRKLTEDDVLMIARAILAHSLKYYKGDDKIKNFIWDLISTGREGHLKNHSGLSAPVPRGRKGKKRKENPAFIEDQERPLDFDPEIVLDNGYKKHLHRHSNKVLLRVRLLYYIKQELIGDEAEKVFQNLPHTEINIPDPSAEGEVPAPWWDADADKSLIIGVFKHGYEKFNCIRSDPALIFLSKCGPPDDAALLAEQEDKDDDDKDDKEKDEDLTKDGIEDDETSRASFTTSKAGDGDAETDANEAPVQKMEEDVKSDQKDNEESAKESNLIEDSVEKKPCTEEKADNMELNYISQNDNSAITEKESSEGSAKEEEKPEAEEEPSEHLEQLEDSDKLPFPDGSLLNVRLRKCITNYQRNHKKRMIKSEQMLRKMERRERTCLNLKEKEVKRKELQNSRWTRREEADFYRTVSTFGVEFSRQAGRFRWDRFREQARLDRKPDESLTEYFHAFYFMCQRVCGKLKPGDAPPNMIFVEPITEERASRCLARIDLLNKVRQDILMHPKLEERVKLCQHSYDMPSWWICGQHDKELLIGAARHGVAKTDFNILRDKTLSFHIVLENSLRTLRGQPAPMNPYPGVDPLTSTPNPKFDRGNLIVGTPTALLHDIRLSDFKKEDPEMSPVKPAQEENASVKEKLKKVVKASMNETSPSGDRSAIKGESQAEEKNEDSVKEEKSDEKEESSPKKSDNLQNTPVASDKDVEQGVSNDEEKDHKEASPSPAAADSIENKNILEAEPEEVKIDPQLKTNLVEKEEEHTDKASVEEDVKEKKETNKDCEKTDEQHKEKQGQDDKLTTDKENKMQVDDEEGKSVKTDLQRIADKGGEDKLLDNAKDQTGDTIVESEDFSRGNQDPDKEREKNQEPGKEREENQDQGKEREEKHEQEKERDENQDPENEREEKHDQEKESKENQSQEKERKENQDQEKKREETQKQGKESEENKDQEKEREETQSQGKESEENKDQEKEREETQSQGKESEEYKDQEKEREETQSQGKESEENKDQEKEREETQSQGKESEENKDQEKEEEDNQSQEKDLDDKDDEDVQDHSAVDSPTQDKAEAPRLTKPSIEDKNTERSKSENKSDVKVEVQCLATKDNEAINKPQPLKTEKDLVKTESEEEKGHSSMKQESSPEPKDSSSIKSEAGVVPTAEKPPAVIEVGDDDDEEDNKPDYVKLKEKIIKTEIERINEERLRREREAKLAAENGIPPYGVAGSKSMFMDDSLLEMEGLEPGEIAPTRYFGPAVEWPKDRVIFHRLEHICYTIEHGEWPFARRPPQAFFPPGGTPTHLADSRSQTPVGALKSDTTNGADSDHSESLSSSDMMTQQIDMKMTFQKRGPGRRRKYEIDPEKVNRIQQLLNQSAAGALSSDDSQSESVSGPGQPNPNTGRDRTGSIDSSAPGSSAVGGSPLSSSSAALVGSSPRTALPKSPLVTSASPSTSSSALSHLPRAQTRHLPSSMLNGNLGDMDHAQLQRHMLEQGMFIPERKRRGRKRRSEKMAELAMAEALAKREQARILAMLDPDTRIPMINLEDGSVLTGKDCPRKRHMEAWLQQHPGYMIDNSICLLDPYLADMRASLASRASRDDKESGSSRHAIEKGMSLGMEEGGGGAGAHKLPSSHGSAASPPVSLRTREHHQMMELAEREEEPNPQFVLNTPEIKPETFVRRRGRKPQLDPRTLDIDRLTGNENVAVVERGSGKKITGSKAPPLKHLRQWLDQNPSFDVEHKWGDLVKAKGVLPKSMDSRILRPSGRGRKPREPLHHSQLRHLNEAQQQQQQQQQQQSSHPYPPASLAALSAFPGAAAAAAAMMGNFPKLPMGLPFAGLPGLPGMANPLLGLQGLGIPGMGLPPHLVKAMEEELREREKEMKEQEKLRERDNWGGESSKEHLSERRRSSGSQPEGSGEDSRQMTLRQTDSGQKDYSSSSSRQAAAAAAAAAAAQAAALAAATSGMKGMSAEQAQQAFAPYLFNPMLYNPLLAAAASQGLQGIQGLGLPTTLAGMLPPGLVLPPHSATSPINSSQAGEAEPSTSHKSSSGLLSNSSSGSSSKHHHHHHRDEHHRHHEHHHHDKRRKLHRQELQEQRLSSPPSSSSTPPTYHSSSSKTNTPVSYAAEDLSVKVSRSHTPQRSSSASPLSPSSHVQDLSVKRHENSNLSSSQDHATDLSVKPKSRSTSGDKSPQRDGPHSSSLTSSQPSSSSGKVPSSSLKVPHKNKIQGSLKLNKILDSLKDRVLKTDPVGKEKASEQIEQASTNDVEESK